MVITVHQ